jgi:putative membrane protein
MKIFRGLVAGAIGGLVGALAMGPAHSLATKMNGAKVFAGRGDDATGKVANAIATSTIGRELRRYERKKGGQFVHLAFGAGIGALYGLLAAEYPPIAAGGGTLLGAAVYTGAHALAVPALGLAPGPQENGPAYEGAELAAHLVYGTVTEEVRRALS